MSVPANEKEVPVLEEFRERIRDIIYPPEQIENDANLLRWVRARELDLDKAVFMLKTSLEWRKKNRVDGIENEPINNFFNETFQCHFGGIDKGGRLVICAPVGEWDFREYLDKGMKDELLRFLVQSLEIIAWTMEAMWRNQFPRKHTWMHTKVTIVIDMKGFTYAKLMHKKSIETLLEAVKLYEANYPETLEAAVVINAPWIFATLFGMIRPLLSEATVSKIKIFDSKEKEWKKAVLALVDEDQIPSRYGGSRDDYNP